MNKIIPKFNFSLINCLICFLPISVILGNLILNLNISFLILLFIYDIFKNKNYKLVFFENKFILTFILIFILLNLLFSTNWQISLRGNLGLLKHIFLYFALIYFFFKDEKNLRLLITTFVLAIMFVLIDSYIQFFFNQDLFGYPVTDSHGRRLSGPFGNEYIVGSFILKTIFLTKKSEYFKKDFSWIIYLFASFILVILASQRMPTIMFSTSLFILFFIDKNMSIKSKSIILLITLFSLLAILNLNPKIKIHYIDRTFQQVGLDNDHNKKIFWDSQWGAHFLTAIEIYKDNIISGSGIKTFRLECSDEKYSKVNSANSNQRCSTHPHNIYFEILSETGSIGVIFFLILFIFFIRDIKLFSKDNLTKNPEVLVLLFIYFWPVQSTGALFSTWNGFFYPLILSYIYYISKKNLKSNSIK